MVDGNFKAENLKMKKPEEDVALHDGLGYMVESQNYDQHLKVAVDPPNVSQIISLSTVKITWVVLEKSLFQTQSCVAS